MKKLFLFVPTLAGLFYSCTSSSQKTETDPKKTAETEGKTGNVTLPQPYATKSSVNFSKVIGWNGNMPKAPEGFTVTRYADSLASPRWVYVLPNGDVLVAEAKKEAKGIKKVASKVTGQAQSGSDAEPLNRILLFRDTNKDGKPDQKFVFLSGLNMPFGMTLANDHIYVANTDAVWKFPYKKGQTAIYDPGKKIMDLPTPEGRHWTRNIISNADGSKLYVSIGSASNVAEDGIEKEHRRACILEINPDGSGERLYASGLRNPVGMAWQPGTKTLWTVVNERDELGDDLVPDFFTDVQDGGFYGWPYAYIGPNVDDRIKEADRKPELVAKTIVPDVLMGAHVSCLGLAFYTQQAFPARYRNGAFIGQHGSWNRSELSGYKVSFVPFVNGKPGEPEDFLTGFIASEEKSEVYGRPVGVAVLPDGSMLVTDDASNIVWRVSYGK